MEKKENTKICLSAVERAVRSNFGWLNKVFLAILQEGSETKVVVQGRDGWLLGMNEADGNGRKTLKKFEYSNTWGFVLFSLGEWMKARGRRRRRKKKKRNVIWSERMKERWQWRWRREVRYLIWRRNCENNRIFIKNSSIFFLFIHFLLFIYQRNGKKKFIRWSRFSEEYIQTGTDYFY